MDKIVGKFNTGKPYTPQGQIIEYSATVLSEETDCFGSFYHIKIDFKDLSRGIYGTTKTVIFDEMTNKEIEKDLMHNYLAGKYTNN